MNQKNHICTLNLRDCGAPGVPVARSPTHERLTRAFSRLQHIELARNEREDPRFEQAVEERIIWRELLELELQDVDEQIERISVAAGNGTD
jgi:hypothetical protein